MFFDTIKEIKYHIKIDLSVWFIYPRKKNENRLI